MTDTVIPGRDRRIGRNKGTDGLSVAIWLGLALGGLGDRARRNTAPHHCVMAPRMWISTKCADTSWRQKAPKMCTRSACVNHHERHERGFGARRKRALH